MCNLLYRMSSRSKLKICGLVFLVFVAELMVCEANTCSDRCLTCQQGECKVCDEGYWGPPTCQKICEPGKYDSDCQPCPSNCRPSDSGVKSVTKTVDIVPLAVVKDGGKQNVINHVDRDVAAAYVTRMMADVCLLAKKIG